MQTTVVASTNVMGEYDVSGTAFYCSSGQDTSSIPTTADLKGLLLAYFSFWGIRDLQLQLKSAGLPVDFFTLAVDGQGVTGKEQQNDAAADNNNNGGDRGGGVDEQNNNNNSGGDDNDSGIGPEVIAGIAICAIAVVVMMVVLGVVYNKQRRRHDSSNRANRGGTSSSAPTASELVGKQRAPTLKPPETAAGLQTPEHVVRPVLASDLLMADNNYDMDDGMSGLFSIEDSLYTAGHDRSVISNSQMTAVENLKYDANRLDELIDSARRTGNDNNKNGSS